jgi:hypothetical protein
MTYTKKQFLEDVAKEAKALKEHAKQDELADLNFDELVPTDFSQCIYGQITGDCNSPRALALIEKCCTKYFVNNMTYIQNNGMSAVKESVAGLVAPSNFKSNRGWMINYLSSIEAYIVTPHAKSKNLIAYLKGETNDLKL